MVDQDAGKETEGALQHAADQVRDVTREMADRVVNAGSAAHDQGSELVAKAPGSALLAAMRL